MVLCGSTSLAAPPPQPPAEADSEAGREAVLRFVRGPGAGGAGRLSLPRRAPPPAAGPLLTALEDGVQFPAVSWSWGKAAAATGSLDTWAAGAGLQVLEGVYREVRSLQPEAVSEPEQRAWLRGAGPDPACCYLLMGFPAPGPGSAPAALTHALLATWRDWTGARYLYLHLPDELRLTRVSLLQRAPARANGLRSGPASALQPPPFAFLALAACRCAHSPRQQALLLDFAQRLRAQRLSAYVTVYAPGLPPAASNGPANGPSGCATL